MLNDRKPIYRFFAGSTILHILSATAVIALSQLPKPQTEIVEIDFSSALIAKEASAPLNAPELQEAAPAANATVEEVPAFQPAKITPVVEIEKSTAPKVERIKPVSAPIVQINKVVETIETPVESSGSEATLDDIETPTLDDSEVVTTLEESAQSSQVSKTEIEEQLKRAEKAQEEKAAILAQQIEHETQSTEQQLGEELSAAESEVETQNAALAAQTKSRTESLRAHSEAIRNTEAISKVEQSKSAANGSGLAAQNAGPEHQGELRALESLRQKPGNPKPQYETHERLKGQQGHVIFKAFVTPSGDLEQFQLLQSTGHRNLDFKTLKALKQWKFYPGQQGWVELPFKWDLKGGPQEMPTLLRRRVSQQN